MSRSHKHGRAAVSSAAFVALGALVAGGLTARPAGRPPPRRRSRESELGSRTASCSRRPGRTATDGHLLVAAEPGQNSSVAQRLTELGATVASARTRSTTSGSRCRQQGRAGRQGPGLAAADLDEVIPLEDPRPGRRATALTAPSTPRRTRPPQRHAAGQPLHADRRHRPRVPQTNPTYDGRGTTIGIVDSGVDLGHPALQTTTTGERKVTDWVTATDPTGDGDPTWVDMDDQVSGPTFTFKGATYTAPAGAYRSAVFDERDPRLGGEVGNDVNRDGNPAGSDGTFAVLWDGTNVVRVDTNQNGTSPTTRR